MQAKAETALLSDGAFEAIRSLLHKTVGISLGDNKQMLVITRLKTRLDALKMRDFSEYVRLLRSPAGRAEIDHVIDALTTNKTGFFREPPHFEFLQELLRGPWRQRDEVRVWCSACSTGEEPYTIGMVAAEQRRPVRVLATDVSRPVLSKARNAIYDIPAGTMNEARLKHHFQAKGQSGGHQRYAINSKVRDMVSFARLNLVARWPMKGPFQLISCRNVMLYFDLPTRQFLVARFHHLLEPGGYLFIGHTETIGTEPAGYRLVQPAVYQKLGEQ